MNKVTIYRRDFLMFFLLLALFSCKKEVSDLDGYTDKIPTNVHLSDYSTNSITVAWDLIEGATSYTAQLLDSKESDSPIDGYTTSFDNYQFNNLNEIQGYSVRVRANVNFDTGDWVYIMNGGEKARIMPKYGFVDEDYEEPEPEPAKELYPNFPEGFENAIGSRKGSHTGLGPTGRQSEVHPTGEWLMENMYTHNVAPIVHKIGSWAVMFRNNYEPYLTMDFDLPLGASKFSFHYSTATQNAKDTNGLPIYVKVEYSQDSGTTWIPLGDNLEVTTVEERYFKEYELDIKGPVRFRIGQVLTSSRLLVDEISVYTNP